MENLIFIEEAAKLLGCKVANVRRLKRIGVIEAIVNPHVKRIRFDKRKLEYFVETGGRWPK